MLIPDLEYNFTHAKDMRKILSVMGASWSKKQGTPVSVPALINVFSSPHFISPVHLRKNN